MGRIGRRPNTPPSRRIGRRASPPGASRRLKPFLRNAAGKWEPVDCPCGEDHGPSLREERDLLLEEVAELEARLAIATADRAIAEDGLRRCNEEA